jgi:hypothetical protein
MRGLVKSVVALGALLMVGSVPSQANTLFPNNGNLGTDPGLIPSIGATITQKKFTDTFSFSLTSGLWDLNVSLTNPFKAGTGKSIIGWTLELFKGATLVGTGTLGLNGLGQEVIGLSESSLTAGSYTLVDSGSVHSLKSAYAGPFSVTNVVPILDTLPLFASGLALLAGLFMWRRNRQDGDANTAGFAA